VKEGQHVEGRQGKVEGTDDELPSRCPYEGTGGNGLGGSGGYL